MPETFEAYRTRVLSYLRDEEPIGVQQATPSQLDRRLRDVAPEELIRRPAPEKWSIAEIVAHLADAELAIRRNRQTSGYAQYRARLSVRFHGFGLASEGGPAIPGTGFGSVRPRARHRDHNAFQ
jgi:hypothetical protein